MKQRVGKTLRDHLPVSRFLQDQIRLEMNACFVRCKYSLLPWRWHSLSKVRSRKDIHANVACGPFVLSGFINLDLFPISPEVFQWDCRWSLPFADASCKGIRAEHFVEHLEPREELPAFLEDCIRVLQPEGVLRIIVPDAEQYLRAYCGDGASGSAFEGLTTTNPFPRDLPTKMDVVNHVFHQWHEHRWGYDFENLARRMMDAGFQAVERTSYGNSRDPQLAKDREQHRVYSLYLDAVKGQ